MKDIKRILDIIDKQASTTVGVLCKRIEVLEKEKALTPSLYKSLVKENIYEQFRVLKKFVELYLTVGTIEFKPPRKDNKS